MSRLSSIFFQKNTVVVAEKLLGKVLVRIMESGVVLRGRIVETEAYLGLRDPSCHSFGGHKTVRTQVMYRSGGCVYVYLIYGKYYCLNIVTANLGEPEAVLIRAIEPLEGIDQMRKNRYRGYLKKYLQPLDYNISSGPGKLCQAFAVTDQLNGLSLQEGFLYVEEGKRGGCFSGEVEVSARVGLSESQDSCYWPLRFYIRNNPYVS